MTESTWLVLDRAGIILGIVLGVVSGAGSAYSAVMWLRHARRERRLLEPIPISLVSAEDRRRRYDLPWRPPRRLVNRAEVLGLLGMIPSRQQRFDWAWLHDPEFMRHLEEIHHGTRHELHIPVTDQEFAQLDLPAS